VTDSSDSNSTEKLLDTIRGEAPPPAAVEMKKPSPEPKGGSSIKTNIKNSLCVGVHIGGNTLSLVLTGEQKQGGVKEVIKWEVIPFPEHLDVKSSRFSAFLRASLSTFIGKRKNVAIWAGISTKQLKLKNIIIPNVPDSKMANAALWGLKKETDIDLQSEVFDYEFISDTRINGVKKKNVVAFTGNKENIQAVKALFIAAGYPLTGITATPFAIQNFSLTSHNGIGREPVVIVNIRRYRSEIFCISENGITVARSVKTGSYSLVENYLESGGADTVHADVPGLLSARTVTEGPDFEPMQDPAFRLIGKIQRTGEYCSNVYLNNDPISKYRFFGETDNCPAFMAYAEEMIPDRVEYFSPVTDISTSMGINLPKNAQDRNGIIPALGFALSHNDYTPNFLYTYIEKEMEARGKRVNIGIMAAGIVGLLVCAGVWGYFSTVENREIKKKQTLETQLAGFKTSVTRDVLNSKITQATKQVELVRRYTNDYISLAVINEICTFTPENISIVSLDSDLKKEDAKKDKGKKKEGEKNGKARSIKIKGIVKADFTSLESTLTGYVIKLGDSPLFGNINLEDKKVESAGQASILKFTADMEIL